MAYYCLTKWHWSPRETAKIFEEDEETKAFIQASIELIIEENKKQEKKIKAASHV